MKSHRHSLLIPAIANSGTQTGNFCFAMVDGKALTWITMRLMLCQMSYGQVGSDNVIFPIPVLSGCTIDNQRNGLETPAKALMTSLIRFTLEPCNFTLNIFQDFVSTFQTLPRGKQVRKLSWNVLINMQGDILAFRNNANIHSLSYSKRSFKIP